MGYIIPVINKDVSEIRGDIRTYLTREDIQKRMVLVIVAIALLLDNMLYMVIVPIIPKFLREMNHYSVNYHSCNETQNDTVRGEHNCKVDYVGEDTQLGYLFASKAILQLIVNPFSGYLIDRIGYEYPMMIGLSVMFVSTATFSFANSYWLLFFARSIQGLGSAFADTSGLAMIADRFTDEYERSKALGIALAFISFGCLVAPPFGGMMFQFAGKPVPFILLALVCLIDAILVVCVIHPKVRRTESGERLQGTPIWRLFMDPYIALCSGALIMANVSLAFLEPTIGKWMMNVMDSSEWEQGIVWLPAFFPHVLGVYVTVKLMRKFSGQIWLIALVGLAMEGTFCMLIPFATSFWVLVIPLSGICFGIALIDTAILPLLAYLVDTRHVSVYGSVYAIADISYSLAYAFGPIVAGNAVKSNGFLPLNLGICLSNLLFCPVLYMLRSVKLYKPIGLELTTDPTGDKPVGNGYTTADGVNMYEGYDQPSEGLTSYQNQNYGGSQPEQQPPDKNYVQYKETIYDRKVKKKNPGYRVHKDTDAILGDQDDDDY